MKALASLILILGSASLLILQSCNRIAIPDVPVTQDVSFDKNIKPITSSVCMECHHSKYNDWSQYRVAFGKRYTIYQKIVVDRSMPLGKYLSEQDRALFRDWVNQGSKP